MNNGGRVIIYAIPFGGGPAGKAALIADSLRNRHNVTLASYSHAVDLLKLSCEGLEVVDCQARGPESLESVFEAGADVFVSMMDVTTAKLVKKAYPRTQVVLVDSLLSWRLKEYTAGQLKDFDSVDSHICQYVPGVEAESLKIKLGHNGDKMHIVAPLVRRTPTNTSLPAEGRILIHFGGLDSPVSRGQQYMPFVKKVTEVIIAKNASHMKLLFAGGMEITSLLRDEFGAGINVSFECLPYRSFQQAIANSSLVLTTPGIETAYESFFIGKPVLFLPPVNSTQLHQMEFFMSAGLPNVISRNVWPIFESIASGQQAYTIKTTLLCDVVNTLAQDDEFHEYLDGSLHSLLESRTRRTKLVHNQRRFWPIGLKDGIGLIETIVDRTIV